MLVLLQDGPGYHRGVSNTTDELEERVEILEATVTEFSEDVNVSEDLIDALQIVNVIATDVTGKTYQTVLLFDTCSDMYQLQAQIFSHSCITSFKLI